MYKDYQTINKEQSQITKDALRASTVTSTQLVRTVKIKHVDGTQMVWNCALDTGIRKIEKCQSW